MISQYIRFVAQRLFLDTYMAAVEFLWLPWWHAVDNWGFRDAFVRSLDSGRGRVPIPFVIRKTYTIHHKDLRSTITWHH